MITNGQQKSILFRIWTFPGYCETFLLSQIVIAIKCGHNVKILVEDLNNLRKGVHKDIIEAYKINDKIIVEDYDIPKSKLFRIFKAIKLVLVSPKSFLKFYKFLKYTEGSTIKKIYQFYFLRKLNNFDIIHVQYGTNVKPLDVLKEIGMLKSKLIVSFHGHDLYFPINGRIPNNGYYNRTFKHSDILVANTFYLKSLLLDLGASENKIKTIPVSVDTDLFYPNNEKKKNFPVKIITVGRFATFKGQRFGVECISKLVKEGFDIHYILIGNGPEKGNVQKLVKEKLLEDHITLAGRKNQEEIREYLQEQDIFLMTSITDPAYGVESQGLVTAEAQACGLPVVAFDSGGVKFTIEDGKTGFIVPEKDVDAMVSKIRQLLDNAELREEMGQKATKFVANNLSQRTIREKWCEIYTL